MSHIGDTALQMRGQLLSMMAGLSNGQPEASTVGAALNRYGDNLEMATLIGNAANLMNDLITLDLYPDLKRMLCINDGKFLHIDDSKTRKIGQIMDMDKFFCGNSMPLSTRLHPQEAVPTCPDCIAKWRRQQGE